MRTAISPRLAIEDFHGRHAACQQGLALSAQYSGYCRASSADCGRAWSRAPRAPRSACGAGLARADHLVDEPARRGDVRVGELLAELRDALGARAPPDRPPLRVSRL